MASGEIRAISNLPVTCPTYSYQWVRVDGAVEANIDGAASATYTPVEDNVGKALKVKVSFTDDDMFAESLTSIATTLVNSSATGAPTIDGTP